MSIPKLVVLALLKAGDKHGYEMEEEMERTKMRIWAKVAPSSIYKALQDLKEGNFVISRQGKAARGPGKSVFSITKEGEKEFARLLGESLESHTPMHSPRITGLVFATASNTPETKIKIAKTRDGLRAGMDTLEAGAEKASSPIAGLVIAFYKDVLRAEIRAFERALALTK